MTTIHTYQYADGKVVPTTVTCEVASGIGLHLTGLNDRSVKECLLRAATALNSLGYHIPGKKIVITVSPANVRGEDSLLDCAIAIALAEEKCPERRDADCFIVGELDLGGRTRSCDAIRNIVEYHAANNPSRTLLIPVTQDIPETDSVKHVRNIAEILTKF